MTEEQQRLYDKRAKLKKEAKQIDTIKANVDSYLRPDVYKRQYRRSGRSNRNRVWRQLKRKTSCSLFLSTL